MNWGAPVGHAGWFRPTSTEFDWEIDVPAPRRCLHCNAQVSLLQSSDPVEHLQEDIIENVYRVVCYRHPAVRCNACGKQAQLAGDGEILGSRIGPELRSIAAWLRNGIGITYRKVPQVIEELYGASFTPAALLGFETKLAEKSQPIVNAFTGTLVTDCYSGYFASVAGAKQKYLANVSRKARDWQKLVAADSPDLTFFTDVKHFVNRACRFHRRRAASELSKKKNAAEKQWLRDELLRLQWCDAPLRCRRTKQQLLDSMVKAEIHPIADSPKVPSNTAGELNCYHHRATVDALGHIGKYEKNGAF